MRTLLTIAMAILAGCKTVHPVEEIQPDPPPCAEFVDHRVYDTLLQLCLMSPGEGVTVTECDRIARERATSPICPADEDDGFGEDPNPAWSEV